MASDKGVPCGCNKGKKVASMDDKEFHDQDHTINPDGVVASTSTAVVASTASTDANAVAVAAPAEMKKATTFKKLAKKPRETSSSDQKGKKVISMDDEEFNDDRMVINHHLRPNPHVASTSTGITDFTTYDSKKAKKQREKEHHQNVKEERKDFRVMIEGETVCCLCKQNFASVKQLYFHLRDHTDDDWKTFFAPPNIKVVDLKECLPTDWSIQKRKRGQPGSRPHADQVSKDEKEAAEGMLLLARQSMAADSSSNGDHSEDHLVLASNHAKRLKVVHDFDINQPAPKDD